MESGILGFGIGIRLRESGIPLTMGIQNPSSTDKGWDPVPGIRNPRRDIQNPRLSWIPLHGADIIWISYFLWVSSSIISSPFFHIYENFECLEEWVTKTHSIPQFVFLSANLLLRLTVQRTYFSWTKCNSVDWDHEKYRVWIIFFKRLFEFGSAQTFWVFVGVAETIVGWLLYCNVDIGWCLFNLFCSAKKLPPFFTPGSADTQQDGQREEDGKTLVWQTWQGYHLHVLS